MGDKLFEGSKENYNMADETTNAAVPPLVSAILVVAEDERVMLARQAVTNFMRQTYNSMGGVEIIVVNAAPSLNVLNDTWPLLKEFRVAPVMYPTIGALRNKGIEEAAGSWVVPFDDDDHHHLHRVALQMACRQEGKCVTLTDQVRLDTNTDSPVIAVHQDLNGIPNTVIFPRTNIDGMLNLYDPEMVQVGEDREFIDRNFGQEDNVVLRNSLVDVDNPDSSQNWFPSVVMSIAFYHSRNKSNPEQFFGAYSAEQYRGQIVGFGPIQGTRQVTQDDGSKGTEAIDNPFFEYVQHVSKGTGLDISVNRSGGFVGPPAATASS